MFKYDDEKAAWARKEILSEEHEKDLEQQARDKRYFEQHDEVEQIYCVSFWSEEDLKGEDG